MDEIEFKLIVEGINIRPPCGSFGYGSSVLILDGKDKILFDTGNFGVRETILDVLDKHTITGLFLSHLHFDHCANIDLFTNVPIYISKKEIESLYKNTDPNVFYPLKYYYKKLNIVPIEEIEKVSERTRVIATPGHTHGHYSLAFTTNDKQIIIAGDAIKTLNELHSDNCCVVPASMEDYLKTKLFIKENFDTIISRHQGIFGANEFVKEATKLTYF